MLEDVEKETNEWMEQQKNEFKHCKDQMIHNLNMQLKQHEALAVENVKHEIKIRLEREKKQMEKQFEAQLFEQKKLYEESLEVIKNECAVAEAQLIDQKEIAIELETSKYEISFLENEVKKHQGGTNGLIIIFSLSSFN